MISHLKGSRDFPRLRIGEFMKHYKTSTCLFCVLTTMCPIGIGRPPGKMDPVNFVMRPFNKQEREEVCTNIFLRCYSEGYCDVLIVGFQIFPVGFYISTRYSGFADPSAGRI